LKATQSGSLKLGSTESFKKSLSKTPLFAALNAREREALLSTGAIQLYENRKQIRGQSSDKPNVFFLIDGAVRVYLCTLKGYELAFALRRRIGDAFVLPPASREATAATQADVVSDKCALFIVPLDVLDKTVLSNHQAASIWEAFLLAQIAELRFRVAELAFFNVRERLAHALAELTQNERDHTVRLTHRELATIVGSSQEQITRELAHLRDEGLVQFAGHRAREIVAVKAINLEAYGKLG
jgi:CRP-like cAMP-binding protein